MDDFDNNTLPSVVGDDVNSTADSSVSHSFYSNSLFSMIRDEDISHDDFLHRLSLKNSHRDNSSASAMVANELLMVASRRQNLQRLDDDTVDTSTSSYNGKEADEIETLLSLAKRLELNNDAGVSSVSSPKSPMQKQIDPPEENGTEPSMTTSQRYSKNKMCASNPRRYRKLNSDGNQKIHAQNSSTCADSKQQYKRRYTDPYCNNEEQLKPDPVETGSPSNHTRTFSDEDSLIGLARRMSSTSGIEDTSSIEGPNDKEYWDNSDGDSSGGNQVTCRKNVSSQESRGYDDEEEEQHTGSNSKDSKMKGLFHLISAKSNQDYSVSRPTRDRSRSRRRSHSRSSSRERRRSSSNYSQSSRYGGSRRTRDRRERRRRSSSSRRRSSSRRSSNSRSIRRGSPQGSLSSNYSFKSSRKNSKRRRARDRRRNSRSNSRTSRRSNSRINRKERSCSGSRSSNHSYQSSRRSVNSSYSSSSRRRMQKRTNTSMLTVAEAVAYLNKQEQMKKSNARKNTVSKVVNAASGLREKVRRRVSSENAD